MVIFELWSGTPNFPSEITISITVTLKREDKFLMVQLDWINERVDALI